MRSIAGSNLGRRIVLLVAVSMLLVVAPLSVSGWLAIRDTADRVSSELRALAQATGGHLEYVLAENLERLDSIRFAPGVDIEDADPEPERRALRSVYLGAIFDGGVFITDRSGTVLWEEPFVQDLAGTNIGGQTPVRQSLQTGKPSVSNVFSIGADKSVIMMVTPLRNVRGVVVGLVGGQIDPLGHALRAITRPVDLGGAIGIDVIDGNGTVLSSNDERRILMHEGRTAREGEPELIELAPLSSAPWVVAVRQPETEALAPVHQMQQRLLIFGLSSMVIALFLSWGMARSLIKPIRQLTLAAQGISQGNLSKPIPELGSDEIGDFSRSLDAMRIALKKSVDEIQGWNRELEARVRERTRQLEDSNVEIERKEVARGQLLGKILTAQEEERKRIARELHDETSQRLAGLVMRMDAASSAAADSPQIIRERLADLKSLAIKTIDSVHKIIFDLRPSVLDDLGLLSALRWYAENRLVSPDTAVRLEVSGEERKLPPHVETLLFRVVQEAVTNVFKHAEAQNVLLSVEFRDSAIGIEIEDDGKGFDVESVSPRGDKAQGLGLLGMKERAILLGGDLHIESHPGRGTRITVDVPLN